uniref:Uncharacterized protein n=1 Tax=Sphaerodactylus townsendi TaxID=933632 RepID=A0ACB8EQQ7_9SAUR
MKMASCANTGSFSTASLQRCLWKLPTRKHANGPGAPPLSSIPVSSNFTDPCRNLLNISDCFNKAADCSSKNICDILDFSQCFYIMFQSKENVSYCLTIVLDLGTVKQILKDHDTSY